MGPCIRDPSETAVSLSQEAEGEELISAEKGRAMRASSLRLDTLDAKKAPNTAPAKAKRAKVARSPKARLKA